MGGLYKYYYVVLYLFVVWSAYIFMVITFIFIQKKRDSEAKLALRSYILPLLGVQSIFYILMLLFGVGAFMLGSNIPIFATIGSMISMVLLVLYIPWQLFCFFQIYDGARNPLTILWKGLKKIAVHYRSCFYTLLVLFLVAMLYQMINGLFFDIQQSFSPLTALEDIMVQSNPFAQAINYIIYAISSPNLWGISITSFLYGLVMCCTLVYYYMVMICIHDEDIKV